MSSAEHKTDFMRPAEGLQRICRSFAKELRTRPWYVPRSVINSISTLTYVYVYNMMYTVGFAYIYIYIFSHGYPHSIHTYICVYKCKNRPLPQ